MPKDLIIIQVEDNIDVAFSNKLSHHRNPHIYTLQTSARFKWHLAFCFLLFKYVGPRMIMQLLPPPWPSQWLWSVCPRAQPLPAPEAAGAGPEPGPCPQSQSLPGAAQPLENCFVCLSKSSIPEIGTTAAGGVGLCHGCTWSLGGSGLSCKLCSAKAPRPQHPSVLAGSEALQQRLIVHPALPILVE